MINALQNNKVKQNFYAKVTAYKLNVRENPSVKSKVIDKLNRGDEVKIEKAVLNKNTIWYKIDNGYISSEFTQLVYGSGLDKEKIPTLKFQLPKIVKKVKNKNQIKLLPTKVKLTTLPPKPKEIKNKYKPSKETK